MKKSDIKFTIELDKENIPEKIMWSATEKPDGALAETKSISVSLWDHEQMNTMRIDLWTKEMPVDQMKRFYVDCLGGMAQTILNSTGDEFMATEMNNLCEKLAEHLRREAEQGK
ncbi:gliding motility protein GldC [Fulvivirga imtechensis]|nr:gliding motility protein GldC [Fulvivirga imtechensis]